MLTIKNTGPLKNFKMNGMLRTIVPGINRVEDVPFFRMLIAKHKDISLLEKEVVIVEKKPEPVPVIDESIAIPEPVPVDEPKEEPVQVNEPEEEPVVEEQKQTKKRRKKHKRD